MNDNRVMPSHANRGRGFFDKMADGVEKVTARAWFFAACAGLVILWFPSIFFVQNVDTWQLLINTPTTIVTFLLVGLSQNTTARTNAASQQKLNAMAAAMAALMEQQGVSGQLIHELETATGLEQEEST